jgi:hypothetical protein
MTGLSGAGGVTTTGLRSRHAARRFALQRVQQRVVHIPCHRQSKAALDSFDGLFGDRTKNAVLLRLGEAEELLQTAHVVAHIRRDRSWRSGRDRTAGQHLRFGENGTREHELAVGEEARVGFHQRHELAMPNLALANQAPRTCLVDRRQIVAPVLVDTEIPRLA